MYIVTDWNLRVGNIFPEKKLRDKEIVGRLWSIKWNLYIYLFIKFTSNIATLKLFMNVNTVFAIYERY